jgi:hypothetical protein
MAFLKFWETARFRLSEIRVLGVRIGVHSNRLYECISEMKKGTPCGYDPAGTKLLQGLIAMTRIDHH